MVLPIYNNTYIAKVERTTEFTLGEVWKIQLDVSKPWIRLL